MVEAFWRVTVRLWDRESAFTNNEEEVCCVDFGGTVVELLLSCGKCAIFDVFYNLGKSVKFQCFGRCQFGRNQRFGHLQNYRLRTG